jgi:hypothetical protein
MPASSPIVPTKRSEIAQAIVRELLIYDPVTGLFEWRPRDRKWFPSANAWSTWNTKNAGKRAFTYADDGCNTGSFFGLGVQAARVAFLYMTGRWPDPEVDHRNGVNGDDRWTNLREATHLQNSANRRRHDDNRSGFKGVTWQASKRKWAARICVKGRTFSLGYHDLKSAAFLAYVSAAIEHHGEFARFD